MEQLRCTSMEAKIVTITLTPELEQAVVEHARLHGAAPEVFLLEDLHKRFLPEVSNHLDDNDGPTMADFFEGFAGTVNSREVIPTGAPLSEDTGTKFKAILQQKYQAGKSGC